MTSPYAPPKAAVADRRPDDRRGSSILAILGGVGVDLLVTETGVFLYGLAAVSDPGLTLLVAVPALDDVMALVIGLGGTLIGGFTAAWIANRRELLHGAVFGVATLAVAELILLVPAVAPEVELPLWRQLAWYALALPAALAGAAWRRRRKRRDAAEAATPVAGVTR